MAGVGAWRDGGAHSRGGPRALTLQHSLLHVLGQTTHKANLDGRKGSEQAQGAWRAMPRLTSTQGSPLGPGQVGISSRGTRGGWQ